MGHITTLIAPQQKGSRLVEVALIPEGTTLTAVRVVPNHLDLHAIVVRTARWKHTVNFRHDTVAVIERWENSPRVCHIRFTRTARLDMEPRFYSRWDQGDSIPALNSRLRLALRHLRVPPLHAPGGTDFFLLYPRERLVGDHSMTGSHGWAVRDHEIPLLLDSIKTIQSNGLLRQVRENGKIIEYDAGSRIVTTVKDATTGERVESVGIFHYQAEFDLSPGKRLPFFLTPRDLW